MNLSLVGCSLLLVILSLRHDVTLAKSQLRGLLQNVDEMKEHLDEFGSKVHDFLDGLHSPTTSSEGGENLPIVDMRTNPRPISLEGNGEEESSWDGETSNRIVGGTSFSDTTKHRYFCSTVSMIGSNAYMSGCGCAFISERWVVTAAHCILNRPDKNDGVFAHPYAPWENNNAGVGISIIPVVKTIMHPHFNIHLWENDVALMKLEFPIPHTAEIISPVSRHYVAPPGTSATIMGFGATYHQGPMNTKLHVVDVDLISNSVCWNMMKGAGYNGIPIVDNMICAFNYNRDACQGDSGGPLVVNDKIAGVVSWGYGCNSGTPGVYHFIESSIDFLEDHVCTGTCQPSWCPSGGTDCSSTDAPTPSPVAGSSCSDSCSNMIAPGKTFTYYVGGQAITETCATGDCTNDWVKLLYCRQSCCNC